MTGSQRTERSQATSGDWRRVGTVGPNVNSYTDPTLDPGDTYRVRAVSPAGVSAPSNQAPHLGARYAVVDLGTAARPLRVAKDGTVLFDSFDSQSAWLPMDSWHASRAQRSPSPWVRDMNNNGTVVGGVQGPVAAGIVWPATSDDPQYYYSPFSFGGVSVAYLLTINDSEAMYGGLFDTSETSDGYSASPSGLGRESGNTRCRRCHFIQNQWIFAGALSNE